MIIALVQILFWLALFALLHTYLLYPLIVILLARKKENNKNVYDFKDLPEITIIMAVHNEEKVIAEKLESVINSNYINDKVSFLIGSDASTDKTDQIIRNYADKYPCIKFFRFNERSGKIKIINTLFERALSPILVLTDANAIFLEDAFYELMKHFRQPDIKVVGGRLINRKSEKEGIAKQEHTYMESEFRVKIAEGKLWGTMMGAYGAFYAIRRENFVKVPENFLVDDFFISLKAIEKEGKAICEPKALAYEDVPGDLMTEFKRKVRISTGNFQNLALFFPMLFSGRFGLAFSFFSHKVLRWIGPILLIIILVCLITLFNTNKIYAIFLVIMLLSLIVPIIDFFSS
jgi:cellulose synthase/poly-beta-1,6-N-acetylglucosamine synthase-like glycosyltransferase